MRLVDFDEAVKYAEDLAQEGIIDDERPFIGILMNCPTVDAIPISYIDTVIDEYTHLVECYLYDDDEDLKEYLCYRNCLNNLKRRWKKQCER